MKTEIPTEYISDIPELKEQLAETSFALNYFTELRTFPNHRIMPNCITCERTVPEFSSEFQVLNSVIDIICDKCWFGNLEQWVWLWENRDNKAVTDRRKRHWIEHGKDICDWCSDTGELRTTKYDSGNFLCETCYRRQDLVRERYWFLRNKNYTKTYPAEFISLELEKRNRKRIFTGSKPLLPWSLPW